MARATVKHLCSTIRGCMRFQMGLVCEPSYHIPIISDPLSGAFQCARAVRKMLMEGYIPAETTLVGIGHSAGATVT